jgi:hypothetical protein
MNHCFEVAPSEIIELVQAKINADGALSIFKGFCRNSGQLINPWTSLNFINLIFFVAKV